MKTEKQRIDIMRAHGIKYPKETIKACDATGLQESYACAMLENETSGGKNIFGGDPGGTALPRRWFEKKVTWLRYKIYKRRRKKGMGANGVGPCQLTSPALQDAADSRGGCHKVEPNMMVGFGFLHQLITKNGVVEGFSAFNGTGPAARAYGRLALRRAETWHQRLT